MKTLSFKPFGLKCINISEMNKDLENNDWKNEFPTLANRDRQNNFVVPNDYFEDSKSRLNDLIFLENLKHKLNADSFVTPANYFNELPDHIEAKIAVDNLMEFKANAFTVPNNYFENLNTEILSKINVNTKRSPKMISLWQNNIMRYASAACFVLLTASGIYFYQDKLKSNTALSADVNTEQMLYDIDENTIIEHLNNTDAQANVATPSAIEEYILDNYTPNDLNAAVNL
jgi:hypothetical protein